MLCEGGYVNLNCLARDKSIYANINKKLRLRILNGIKNNYNSVYKFEKEFEFSNLYDFLYQNKRIKLGNLFKLMKLLKLTIKNLNRDVIWIGTKTGYGIRNPKIPFNLNDKHGFRLISAIIGDGGLNKKLVVEYHNTSKMMIDKVINAAINVFGKIERIDKRKNIEKVISIRFPTIVGRIVNGTGLTPGRKTIVNPKFPPLIFKGSKESKNEFLKQMSDDEGSPQINIPHSYSVRFEFAVQNKKRLPLITSNLIIDLHKLVNGLGYNTTRIYNSGRYGCKGKNKGINVGYKWAFDIQGKDSLIRFNKEIGFSIPYRRLKLLKGIKAIKKNQLGTEKMYKAAIENFNKIYEREGFVNKYTLAKEANITLRNSIEWLMKLHRKDLIKVSKENTFLRKGDNYAGLNGRTPNEYVLCWI